MIIIEAVLEGEEEDKLEDVRLKKKKGKKKLQRRMTAIGTNTTISDLFQIAYFK